MNTAIDLPVPYGYVGGYKLLKEDSGLRVEYATVTCTGGRHWVDHLRRLSNTETKT
jgi:hypothetical protein